MADLALVTSGRVAPVSGIANGHEQYSFEAAEQINVGQVFRINSAGKAVKAAGDTLANAGQVTAAGTFVSELYVAIDQARQAGNAVTGMKKGLLDGFNLDSLAIGAQVFLSNTVGSMGDVAGTVATPIGRVQAAPYTGTPSGADKVLKVATPPYC